MPSGPILIVDDEPQQLRALEQILAPHYATVGARDGSGAMAAALLHRPSLILLDERMPDIHGHAACRQLKAHSETAHIPVILATDLADREDLSAGLDAGAVDYIVKPVKPALVLARVRTHMSVVKAALLDKSYRDAIHMLGTAGRYNDNDTGVHIWRMAAYARALARAVGWSDEHCALMELAAAMHDTGKIGIPNAILKKRGPLDAAEWTVMKTHCQLGHDILSKSDAPLFRLAAEIALRHHERWDGSGYPGGLAGTEIPESARIVALADVFDALSIQRPYKSAWQINRVMEVIRGGAGGHFEPRLVEAFVNILPEILAIQATWQDREEWPETIDPSGIADDTANCA